MATEIKSNLFKYEGSVYVAPLNASTDAFEGYLPDPIECRVMELSRTDGEVTELKSKQIDRYDQVIVSEETSGTPSVAVEFLEITAAIRALLFAGTNSVFTQSSGTITASPITIPVLDRWFPLLDQNLDEGTPVVVKDESDSTTYTLGDDYEIDYRQGLIKAVDGGAITAADVIHVTYDKLAKTGITTLGETNLAGNFRLKFDGKNRYTGKYLHGEIWQVNLKSTEAVDMLSSEPVTAKLEGPMVTPTGKTSPYYLRSID